MPAKAGQIVIDVTAGTAKMVVDLEAAKGKLREFGATGQGSARQAALEMKILEGNIGNNTRAVSQFLIQTLKIGPAVQASFAVFGGVALVGMLTEAGKKVYEFFKAWEEGAAKARSGFENVYSSVALTNTELELSNVKLANQIAKLEHKPKNMLLEALLEDKKAAEELSQALQGTADKVAEVLDKNKSSFMEGVLFGGGNSELSERTKKYQESLGHIRYQGSTGDLLPADVRMESGNATGAYLKDVRGMLADARATQQAAATPELASQYNKLVAELEGVISALDVAQRHVSDVAEHGKLEGDLGRAQAGAQDLHDLQEFNREQHAAAQWNADFLRRIGDRSGTAGGSLNESDRLGIERDKTVGDLRAQAWEHAGQGPLSPEIEAAIQVYVKQMDKAIAAAIDKDAREFQSLPISTRNVVKLFGPSREDIERQGADLETRARVSEIGFNSRREALTRQAGAAGEGVAPGQAGIDQAYIIRLRLADQLNKLEEERIAKEADANQKTIDQARATADLTRAYGTAAAEYRKQTIDLQKQQLNQITGPLSAQLANLATGQKTSFGETIKGIGHEIVQKTIQSQLNKLITGKPDGSQKNPFWIRDASSATPGAPGGNAGGGGILGTIQKVLNKLGLGKLIPGAGGAAADGAGDISQAALGDGGGVLGAFGGIGAMIPALAGGGDVTPGQAYWVGDGGEPELFSPRSSGTITPASKLSGGGTTYNIDARGADLGAHNRIARGLEASHAAQPGNAVRAQAERQKRTPQRSKH